MKKDFFLTQYLISELHNDNLYFLSHSHMRGLTYLLYVPGT